jgi:hypothetical protein
MSRIEVLLSVEWRWTKDRFVVPVCEEFLIKASLCVIIDEPMTNVVEIKRYQFVLTF